MTTSPLSSLGFIAECEREQLQYAQAIQPVGVLLGGRCGDPHIRYVSANVHDWLERLPEQVFGQTLADVLVTTPESLPEFDTTATRDSLEKVLYANVCDSQRYGSLDGLWSRTATHWLLELECALPAAHRHDAHHPVPHHLYRMPYSEEEWQQYCQLLVNEVRTATGFDRVLLYRFHADDCGEVVAESCLTTLTPYLGLRFPASDIPRIARTLYVSNRHRHIVDVNVASIPVIAQDGSLADLTLSDLRAVSPIHVEYLKHMDVTASASFSLVLSGRLWGLVACHHCTPRLLPLPVRERCADMAQVFTLSIAGYQNSRRLFEVSGSDHDIGQLLEALHDADATAGGQAGRVILTKALLAFVNAEGAALIDDDQITTFGFTPDVPAIQAQLAWLRQEVSDNIFATDALPQVFPSAAAYAASASGLLAVRIQYFKDAGEHERIFLWWRPEQPQMVYWAGDPRKSTALDAQSQHLSPRSSFERWIETTTGRCEPWSDADRLRAKKFRSLILRTLNAKLLKPLPPYGQR